MAHLIRWFTEAWWFSHLQFAVWNYQRGCDFDCPRCPTVAGSGESKADGWSPRSYCGWASKIHQLIGLLYVLSCFIPLFIGFQHVSTIHQLVVQGMVIMVIPSQESDGPTSTSPSTIRPWDKCCSCCCWILWLLIQRGPKDGPGKLDGHDEWMLGFHIFRASVFLFVHKVHFTSFSLMCLK